MPAISSLALLALALLPAPGGLRFEVALGAGLTPQWNSGRLLLVLGDASDKDPRRRIGETGLENAPILGCDVPELKPGLTFELDGSSAIAPIASLAALPAGDYSVQAVFRCNPDLRLTRAPGNLSSEPVRVHLDPANASTTKLELTRVEPPEELPADTDELKFLKFESRKLSAFWGRPMFLRASVRLPPGFATDTDARYPLLVRIGGYGQRFTSVGRGRGRTDEEGDGQRFVTLQLDGAGPLGDPYQVDSANHGPYGAALTEELIPFVEQKFRCIGEPRARFTTGGSTGGWVSFALQVFYPDFFNGCWSFFPDGVDFRCFQLVDVYEDANAYVNRFGFERASKRNVDGETEYTMRHECGIENVLGEGDSYVFSGGQWGAWNATYSPRGEGGKPMAIWDPKTGAIDKRVAEQWKKYDLRLVLQENWKTLGPKLAGKIHVYVGDADDYFLNNAVVRLQRFLEKAKPEFGGTLQYGWRGGHGWTPLSSADMLKQMAARLEAAARAK
ncbi:MAG: esterase [Planctomycetes bacterium]|nr:esterase [Planctomycetota bacterium]